MHGLGMTCFMFMMISATMEVGKAEGNGISTVFEENGNVSAVFWGQYS